MKNKKYTLVVSVASLLFALPACDDYLEVDSPSSFSSDYVFSESEIEKGLTSIYSACVSSKTYGSAYLTTFCLNSDVEMATNSNELRNATGSDYRLFDANANGTALASAWCDAYSTIERANNFIAGAEATEAYQAGNAEYLQMVGEAKCLRAMNYFDLLVLCGDIPFSFTPATELETQIMPIVDRNTILDNLISDLEKAALDMKFASDVTIERCSKEFAWALIARMSLFRGGYSLRPQGESLTAYEMKRADDYLTYYDKTIQYADSVIKSGTHQLGNDYKTTFLNECNFIVDNAGDAIFEIPFANGLSGNVGYSHGPKSAYDDPKRGTTNGALQLNCFYRWSFDPADLRRDFIVGLWDYAENTAGFTYKDEVGNDVKNTTLACYPTNIMCDELLQRCNKWSKLWSNGSFGQGSSGNTGINFPYMRYADVLLMYAEAVNERNGAPTAEAFDCINKVRERAGLPATTASNHDDFFLAIMDERAWEFGGEGLRWKDLVRWNKYSEVIYRQFHNYSVVANLVADNTPSDAEYDVCTFYKEEVDSAAFGRIHYDVSTILPQQIYYTYDFSGAGSVANSFPCSDDTYVPFVLYNAYSSIGKQEAATHDDWNSQDTDAQKHWGSENSVNDNINYSFRGYIRSSSAGKQIVDNNGQLVVAPNITDGNYSTLPAVRYILPIPRAYVGMSRGQYVNHYGY